MTQSKSKRIVMETDIVSQAIGLGGNTDFFFVETFFTSRFCCKISYYHFNSKLSMVMGTNFDKYKLFKKSTLQQKNSRIKF